MLANLIRRVRAIRESIALRRGDKLAREQGQAVLRAVITAVIMLYMVLAHASELLATGIPRWLWVGFAFLAGSLLIATQSLRDSDSRPWRRISANAADIAMTSYMMVATGDAGTPMFMVYLWVTLGNGFRFGRRALMISAILSVIGFCSVIWLSPVWSDHETLSAGILLALIILPMYASHLLKQLSRAIRRAEAASAAKSEFLARMSHELRTPLNGILGATELLGGFRGMPREAQELIGVVRKSAEVSLRQVGNVLDFAKIEAGKLTLDDAPFKLYELLQGVARMVRVSAREKGLRVLVRVSPQLPPRVKGDAHHLREILLNLVSNAVKFTERGMVCLEATRQQIGTQAWLRFEVHDTGIGISADALPHIFESFMQETTGTRRRYGGTGLGTTIARELAELMGGRIGAESAKGQGSTFWVELPLTEVAEPEVAVNGERALLWSTDSALATRFVRTLSGAGAAHYVVGGAKEALSALVRSIRTNNPYTVVFVDGVQSGARQSLNLADELCDKANQSDVPVVLITDESPGHRLLRDWGYTASIERAAPSTLVLRCLALGGKPRADTETSVVTVEPWAWKREAGRAPRLLIADDNETNAMILGRLLERAGYEVVSVADGEQALDQLLTDGFRAAILDMHMPELDGPQVIRRYRLLRPRSRLPLVVLTADASLPAQQECAEAGADGYLTKPIRAQEVLPMVERLIEEHDVVTVTPLRHSGDSPAAAPDDELPVLDVTVLGELDRLYGSPAEMDKVLIAFRTDAQRLLRAATQAVEQRNHPAFVEALHALKGNAANVGALRLAHACTQIERAPLHEFRRDGAQLMQDITDHHAQALRALAETFGSPDEDPRSSPPGEQPSAHRH